MSTQNVFVVNCESAEGTQVVGVYFSEKLGRAAAKDYVEEYYEEGVMKVKKAKSEDGRKVLYAEEKGSAKITINEISCEMPVAKGAKKDPKAPKKGLSAYMIFAKENRERIKVGNPDADFGTMGKLIGNAWKALTITDKIPFNVKSETDKKRYETEIAEYKVVKKVEDSETNSEMEEVEDVEVKPKAKKTVKKTVKKVEVEDSETNSEMEEVKKVVEDVEVKPKVKKTVKKTVKKVEVEE